MTQDIEDALLPCPFCNGSAYVADDYGSSFSVKCNNPMCGAAVRLWGTRDGAITAWNRRAPPSKGDVAEDALRAAASRLHKAALAEMADRTAEYEPIVSVRAFTLEAICRALLASTRTGGEAVEVASAQTLPHPYEPVIAGNVAGWQPIETAPKDGTYFIAYSKSNDEYCVAWWPWVTHCTANTWAVGGAHNDPVLVHNTLTHWMPLPEPPP